MRNSGRKTSYSAEMRRQGELAARKYYNPSSNRKPQKWLKWDTFNQCVDEYMNTPQPRNRYYGGYNYDS